MTLTVATYNLLDLFDLRDGEPDERKIDALAEVVRRLDADVIAFQEVGSIDALRAILAKSGGGFSDPVVGRADKRGIACAIASKRAVLDVAVLDAATLPFPAFHEDDPAPFGARLRLRRSIPVVRIDGGHLGPITFLSLHWKSRRATPLTLRDGTDHEPTTVAERAAGDLRSLVQRAAEALFLRKGIDEILAARPTDAVCVCGDFNDVSGSVPLQVVVGEGEGMLEDVGLRVPVADRWSVLHGGAPAAIDHVLLTPGIAKQVQNARFLNEGLLDPDALPEGTPVLPSDHAPLVVTLL